MFQAIKMIALFKVFVEYRNEKKKQVSMMILGNFKQA